MQCMADDFHCIVEDKTFQVVCMLLCSEKARKSMLSLLLLLYQIDPAGYLTF